MVLIYFSHVEATVLDPMARRNHFRQQASLPLLCIAGTHQIDMSPRGILPIELKSQYS
jgi:hypothetical protein